MTDDAACIMWVGKGRLAGCLAGSLLLKDMEYRIVECKWRSVHFGLPALDSRHIDIHIELKRQLVHV